MTLRWDLLGSFLSPITPVKELKASKHDRREISHFILIISLGGRLSQMMAAHPQFTEQRGYLNSASKQARVLTALTCLRKRRLSNPTTLAVCWGKKNKEGKWEAAWRQVSKQNPHTSSAHTPNTRVQTHNVQTLAWIKRRYENAGSPSLQFPLLEAQMGVECGNCAVFLHPATNCYNCISDGDSQTWKEPKGHLIQLPIQRQQGWKMFSQ